MFTGIAEQGYEMGRPSDVRTELTLAGGDLTALKVGGIATKTLEGTLRIT
jgi:trans-2,3-dihydro-3-hydroxyanthranilate isomerase